MPQPLRPPLPPPPRDAATLEYALKLLAERLHAVHGAGGCPTRHDSELRGALTVLRELVGQASARAKSGVRVLA